MRIKNWSENKKYMETKYLSKLWKTELCYIFYTVSVYSQSKCSTTCAFKSDLPLFTALRMRSQEPTILHFIDPSSVRLMDSVPLGALNLSQARPVQLSYYVCCLGTVCVCVRVCMWVM